MGCNYRGLLRWREILTEGHSSLEIHRQTRAHTLASDIKRDEAPHTQAPSRPPTHPPPCRFMRCSIHVSFSAPLTAPPLPTPRLPKKTCAQNKSQPFPTHSRWSAFLLLRFRKLIFIWLILLASLPVTRFWDYFRHEAYKRTNDGNCCQSLEQKAIFEGINILVTGSPKV